MVPATAAMAPTAAATTTLVPTSEATAMMMPTSEAAAVMPAAEAAAAAVYHVVSNSARQASREGEGKGGGAGGEAARRSYRGELACWSRGLSSQFRRLSSEKPALSNHATRSLMRRTVRACMYLMCKATTRPQRAACNIYASTRRDMDMDMHT